ncbi:MAG: dTDP-4-dehydrorhamnose reductase [Proteobacteria bacterium]|nr:dTDP-4-dehydrorhamnose reductase [Pseudomonadota bacterium]
MKVLITGSQGMLGGKVREVFTSTENEVVGIDLEEANIADLDSITTLIEKVHPELVIHTAAMTDVDGCEKKPESAFKINALGTRNVTVGAKKAGSRLVYISTDYVFDGTKRDPYTEQDSTKPISVYGSSKLAGENYVRELLPEHYIVRTAWLFGKPGKDFPSWVVAQVKKGLHPRIFQDQIGSPTYAPDLARIIQEISRKEGFGTYHVTNSGSCSRVDQARLVLESAGLDPTAIVPVNSWLVPLPAKRPPQSPLVSLNLAPLGISPLRSWEEATKEYCRLL